VQVLDFERGERLPVFAELDVNVAPGDRQALLIRPMVRLRPGARYVVALVGLHDPAGRSITPAPFRALRDRGALSRALRPLAPRYEQIFAALAKAGVSRGSLTLAWDVITASDGTATSHLVGMRDLALSMADAGALGYTIASVDNPPKDPHVLRALEATVRVPSFLAGDSATSTLSFGPDGQPAMRALVDVPISIRIPICARGATRPLPVVVFGHGLFSSARSALDSGELMAFADQLCAVFIATDWMGLATPDVPSIATSLAKDLNLVYLVTDRLQQAHVNTQVMTRLFRSRIKDDPALTVADHPVTDGSEVYYYGISNGGIQGGTFMGLSPDVVRGALNVPGCEWSLLVFRSTDFNSLKTLLYGLYPDLLDEQLAIAMVQSEFDYTDPATFAPHLLTDPLPGAPIKRILVQESIGDAEVTNLSTRVLARTIGLDGLNLVTPVYGVLEKDAPMDSAYTQWDTLATPQPPAGDIALPDDNGAHQGLSGLPAVQAQIQAFFHPDGRVTQTCPGPCVFGGR
jgi:hypothetical protein